MVVRASIGVPSQCTQVVPSLAREDWAERLGRQRTSAGVGSCFDLRTGCDESPSHS